MDNTLDHLRTEMAGQDNGLPLYRRHKAGLETLVGSGVLKPGDVLPRERTLAEALNLSRVTVRKAIKALVEEGRLRRRQGSKTEIASHVEKSLSTLTSFSEDMESRGLAPQILVPA